MDRRVQASRALRWSVVPVDDSLLAIEYVDNEISGYPLTVDAGQRVVRSGKKSAIKVPALPDHAELVAAARVEDRLLAVPATLLVFRCSAQADGLSQRPSKRARRASLSQSSQSNDEPSTRLLFYALFGDTSSDARWVLQPLGDVAVAGEAVSLEIHVVDGPAVVVFNSATCELTLLETAITDAGDYAFAPSRSALKLPGADHAELLSCQFVGEEVTPTPHVLLKYRPIQIDQGDESPLNSPSFNWQSTSERQLWATLTLSDNCEVSPCGYFSSRWMRDDASGMDDFITACAFAAPFGSCTSNDVNANVPVSKSVRLHPSVTAIIGTSSGIIHAVANEVSLATYVVAGSPRQIEIISFASASVQVGVRCADADCSFHVISISPSSRRERMIAPLQHFTFVGPELHVPQDLASLDVTRLILLNEVDSTAEVDFLQLSLRKSVLVDFMYSESGHCKSSCHRLKYRTEEKGARQRRTGKQLERDENSFQCVERVKLDKSESDFEAHRTNNTSSASEQQLLQLTKSLEERLRIGHEQSLRLESVLGEKMRMIRHLNRLLQASAGTRDHLLSNDVDREGSIATFNLAPVVELNPDRQSAIDTDSQIVSFTPSRATPPPYLEKVSIRSFDPSTSILLVILDVRASSFKEPQEQPQNKSKVYSVVAFERSTLIKSLRSWSRVISISSLPQIDERFQSRIRVELAIDIPATHPGLRKEPLYFGLWLRTETIAGTTGSALTSSDYVGDLEVDLVSVIDKLRASREIFATGPVDPDPTHEDQILLLSGGSSIQESISGALLDSTLLQPAIIRPLFAVLTSAPTWAGSGGVLRNHAMTKLFRALPDDVIPMLNPLAVSSLDIVQKLLSLLQSEIDSLQALENSATSDKIKADQHFVDLMTTQIETDQQAVRLFSELQRRINFHSMWELSKK